MKMNKAIIIGGIVAGFLLFMAFCFYGLSLFYDVSQNCSTAKNPGDLFVVGFECGYKPYGFLDKDSKSYEGYDIDLARELAKRSQWKLVLKPINWKIKEQLINTDTIDCIWNGFKINGREDLYEWSKPYLETYQVVIVQNNSGIKKLADLKGKSVAVQETTPLYHSLMLGSMKDVGKSWEKIVPVDEYAILMDELYQNRVDAVVTDYNAAVSEIKKYGDKYVVLNEVLLITYDGIAFKKGNKILRDQVQKTLDEMVVDGTVEKITKKWFGENISRLK